ncbi:hypothetical protein ABZ901_34590, partial [Actinacidiphila alni]|uniref:hypothetical protein n=1 Tax=Actinacidiphila alni TaxID=380248 RepID=UPI0033D7B7AD
MHPVQAARALFEQTRADQAVEYPAAIDRFTGHRLARRRVPRRGGGGRGTGPGGCGALRRPRGVAAQGGPF